ncbi:MAG: ABC transporter permease [Chloroflexi bacterium]|nr:ABC transporter permease [Chloroflexota bacterium]
MQRYVSTRLALMIPTLFGVAVTVFLIIHLTPGDPAVLILGQDATPEALAALRSQLGTDRPLPVQFVGWFGHVLQGDLGHSIWLQRPVLPEVLDRLQATALLAAVALSVSTAVGVLLGIVAAIREHSIVDRLAMLLALVGVSAPSFWIGIMLIVLFSLTLRWLPPTGMLPPGGGDLSDLARHLILPTLTLAAPSMAIVARLTRASMLEVVRQDYIRTAAAKGLRERVIVWRHALKNALIPVVTVIGVQIGTLLGGAVVVETVFAWPGLGSLIVKGVLTRDFPLVQGAVLVLAVNFAIVNLLADLALGFLDPRIRYG